MIGYKSLADVNEEKSLRGKTRSDLKRDQSQKRENSELESQN